MNDELRRRIEASIDMEPMSGCWLWNRDLTQNGYGDLRLRGKHIRAHRAAYSVYVGPIPDGLLVCHRCDVKPCCNPAHLFVGTSVDNMIDCIRKGRAQKIESNWKFGFDVVQKIRASKVGTLALAREHGVYPSTIIKIRAGRSRRYG